MKSNLSLYSRGFTLLELMVSVALMGMVAGAIVFLLRQGFTAWQRTDAGVRQIFQIEKGLDALGEELRNAVALKDSKYPFEWEKETFTFYTAERPAIPAGSTATNPPELLKITYRLQPNPNGSRELVREVRTFPPESASPKTETILPRVSEFKVEYGFLDGTSGSKSLKWETQWNLNNQHGKELPRVLRVQIGATDASGRKGRSRSVTKIFMIPHGIEGTAP